LRISIIITISWRWWRTIYHSYHGTDEIFFYDWI